jgi:hypothetical protein
MSSIYTAAVDDIFNLLDEASASASAGSDMIPDVSVSFFEIVGDECLDLLNSFKPTQLLTGSCGKMTHPYPVAEVLVGSAEELKAFISHGCSVRVTAATGVHDSSSRYTGHGSYKSLLCNDNTFKLIDPSQLSSV